MSITILNYFDQALVDSVRAQAAARAQEASQAQTTAQAQATETSGTSFSDVLGQAAESYTQPNASAGYTASYTDTAVSTGATGAAAPADLSSIFEEAANTFGVSVNLLQSIAKAESNFNANAVSSAGAVGIMQLMPATAAALGVTDSRDAYQNIMGGAKYISQLLQKYSGNISLALAAYNAGSANVDKYGGVPPFSETQNYVKKVLSYLENGVSTDFSGSTFGTWNNTSSDYAALGQTIANLLAGGVSNDTLDALSNLIQTLKTDDSGSAASGGTSGTGDTSGSGSSADSDYTNSVNAEYTAVAETEHAPRAFSVKILNGEMP